MSDLQAFVPAERIERAILVLRGQRVMLDSDLAALYGVEVRALNQGVKRNAARFPDDFAFSLTNEEWAALRSQAVISNDGPQAGRGGRRYPPMAFTEHGVVMLASVLNSPIAVEASIQVARAFVRMRQLMALEGEIRQRLEALEGKTDVHEAHLAAIYDAIGQLMAPPDEEGRRIGFRLDEGPGVA